MTPGNEKGFTDLDHGSQLRHLVQPKELSHGKSLKEEKLPLLNGN